jgi:hypothetical protein
MAVQVAEVITLMEMLEKRAVLRVVLVVHQELVSLH